MQISIVKKQNHAIAWFCNIRMILVILMLFIAFLLELFVCVLNHVFLPFFSYPGIQKST